MLFVLGIVVLLNTAFCFAMDPEFARSKLLNLRSQILIVDQGGDGEQEAQSCAKSGNKQLRLMFDIEANCLHCALCNGLNVEKSFPLPFYTQPSEAVTDVNVYGFDFIKPGTLFAIILAKKKQKMIPFFLCLLILQKSCALFGKVHRREVLRNSVVV